MSSGFHVATGTAMALGTHRFLGIATWSNEFWLWMILLVVASNAADVDGIWWKALDRWVDTESSSPKERRRKLWCATWLGHRRFFHSFLALLLDLWCLVWITKVLQLGGQLPQFDPTLFFLVCLVIHLAVDTIDGSEGIQLFAPLSSHMVKFRALCMDLDWHHRDSTDPVVRAAFFWKVRCEACLCVCFNAAGILVAFRL